MTVAETYLVFFAAIDTADSLFVIWLAGTLIVNAAVYFLADKTTQSINTWILILYGLFAVALLGRWGVTLNKVMDLAQSLRDHGESLPASGVTATLGVAMAVLCILSSAITLSHLWSRRRKVRII